MNFTFAEEIPDAMQDAVQTDDQLAVNQLLDECWKSTPLYLKTFYPEVFSAPWGQRHGSFFEVVDDHGIRFIVICTHREFGKTTIVRHGLIGKPFVYGSKDHMLSVFVQPSETDAQNSLGTVRNQFETNQRIKNVFGELKSKKWSNEMLERSETGNIIVPRGRAQSVRGININDNRPQFVVLDDVEKTDKITSDIERVRILDWAYTDVIRCLSELDGTGRLIVIGNMMHEDGLIANLIADKKFENVVIPLCDDNFKTYWPAYMTNEEVAIDVANHRERGKMNQFYREMMCKPSGSETQLFKTEYFRYYNSTTVPLAQQQENEKYVTLTESDLRKDQNIVNVLTVDPAGTVSLTSDYTAMVLSGFNRKDEHIYVREIVNERFGDLTKIDPKTKRAEMEINSLVTRAFDIAEKNLCSVIGVEVAGLKEFIIYPFRLEAARRGSNIKIIELSARGGKNSPQGKERIASLVDLYKKGYIIHNEAVCNVLESQLISYPNGKHDDVADALAYLLMVLDMGLVYFDPPDYGYEGVDSVEAEYDDLYNDMQNDNLESVDEDWRTL